MDSKKILSIFVHLDFFCFIKMSCKQNDKLSEITLLKPISARCHPFNQMYHKYMYQRKIIGWRIFSFPWSLLIQVVLFLGCEIIFDGSSLRNFFLFKIGLPCLISFTSMYYKPSFPTSKSSKNIICNISYPNWGFCL